MHRTPELKYPNRRYIAAGRRAAASATDHASGSHKDTVPNKDELRLEDEGFPSNFTKGLPHGDNGIATNGYPEFVNAINRVNEPETAAADFGDVPTGAGTFTSTRKAGGTITWRGWESPRTGHYFDLEGGDADAVGMAPAPAMGSDELTAEMAEVYAMALLRDVPFSEIELETGKDPATGITVKQVIKGLNAIGYFSTPAADAYVKRRQAARLLEPSDYEIDIGDAKNALPQLTGRNLFRGSGPGAKAGPSISQFMLLGNEAKDVFPVADQASDIEKKPTDGFIAYGSQYIDQRSRVFKPGLDYMTNWDEWLDVQNGADVRNEHFFEPGGPRFLTTPRDLATYVRFDALYQAYLNACLILLGIGHDHAPFQPGFPDKNIRLASGHEGPRTGFAAFGGPHILSLVTEVATRCLKFARRQKFNWHRRARPEKISGLLTLAALNGADKAPPLAEATQADAAKMVSQLGELADLVHQHNQDREKKNAGIRRISAPQKPWLANGAKGTNLLLAMAFPEGSPMHPSYAAGHATVAGGCVTMLKAFFKTLDENKNYEPIGWGATGLPIVEGEPGGGGKSPGHDLREVNDGREAGMTLEGELNKLAANISLARNMAGVHYYSDYYDSLRMGERVAVGILVEQMRSYDEPVEIVFRSFDGDIIKISTAHPDAAEINGSTDDYKKWVQRPQT